MPLGAWILWPLTDRVSMFVSLMGTRIQMCIRDRSQTQRQFQCRLCRAGTHQRTVGAGDEELFYIDGLTAGRTPVSYTHLAERKEPRA